MSKTNSSKSNDSVWILHADMDYEGGYIVGVYGSESLANRKKERIEAQFRNFERKNETWTKITDAEEDSSLWPDPPQMPENYGCNLTVVKYRIIHLRNKEE